MRPLLSRLLAIEVIRYYLVAGSVALLYLALYGAALALGVFYFVAILIAQAITIAVAFPLYRRFVFGSRGSIAADFARFLSVWLSGMIAGLVATPLLVELLHMQPFIAQVISIVVVSVGSFVAHKFFSFRTTSAEKTGSPTEVEINRREQD